LKTLKDLELKLISELMKNSRRSDREIAHVLGVSQPTVSRTIKKLEKEGILKEYTVIPDFAKLGIGLLAMTFVKLNRSLGKADRLKAEKFVRENLEKSPFLQIVLAERGLGFTYDSVIVSLNKDYSSYVQLLNRIKTYPHIEVGETRSFLIDLNDKSQYRTFTFRTLAHYLASIQK
jgi:DNA-binding Lrp family transcriptional regulator